MIELRDWITEKKKGSGESVLPFCKLCQCPLNLSKLSDSSMLSDWKAHARTKKKVPVISVVEEEEVASELLYFQ